MRFPLFQTVCAVGALILVPLGAVRGQSAIPAQSGLGQSAANLQRVLLSPLGEDSSVGKAGWQLDNLQVSLAPPEVVPKLGSGALMFGGTAKIAGAKGDFTIASQIPGAAKWLGMWIYLAPDANVERVGFQINDAQNEALTWTVAADWQGWKWVEADLGAKWTQAYAQNDKDGRVGLPVGGVHVVWFSKAPGASRIGVNALTAATELQATPATSIEARLSGAEWSEAGQGLKSQIVLTNFHGEATPVQIEYSLQRDSTLFSPPASDPILGVDEALGAKSWTEVEGARIDEGSLTDGKDWTGAGTAFKKAAYTEAFQFVDLEQQKTVRALSYQAGDANWVWKVDVAASLDGTNYTPVPELQNVDLRQKWGAQKMPSFAAFPSRFLRLRYHNEGAPVDSIRMPSELSVFDGVADEKWELPSVGEIIERGTLSPQIGARNFDAVALSTQKPLSPGAYLLSAKIQSGAQTQLLNRHFFVLPAPMKISPASRFGLNSSGPTRTPSHERLGIGWARFENMKWPMISPAPDVYKFDGTVGPWFVPHDAIVAGYRAQGISVLPFLFQSAPYATSAPAEASKRGDSYPPRDNALMADFVFQTVARYGSRKHAADVLKTPDKKSGLNQINVFEIWNEPNLTAPSWGPWVGTTAQYLEMFRASAEAVKRADPQARVTNGGYAGIEIEVVDPLRSYQYADGKRPLDFVDILNVHYYSGRIAPELATVDTNVDRSGKTEGGRSYEQTLERLMAWRDANKPGMPVWLTETGYDSAGPFGTNEAMQAARLPRVVMLALASGVEKVFVYREAGSTPTQHAASGLAREDGTLKPSWFTYATLIRELDGAVDGARLPHPNPNVRLYSWKRGQETILSAWAVDGTAKLDLNLGRASATDAFGQTQTHSVEGAFPLSTYPTYFKNITDLKAIESLQAQARREQLARQKAAAQLAKARAYLFDFGSLDKIGSLDLGTTRPFTPVVSTNAWDEAKGFGFSPGAAMSDNVQGWVNDALERDASRLGKGMAFRFRAVPGRYTLRVGAAPLGARVSVKLSGVMRGETALEISKNGAPAEIEIEVGEESLALEFSDYTDLRWLSLVEVTR